MYAAPEEQTLERTIDLAEIAKINRGDRVRVEQLEDGTQQLFSKTISLLDVGESPDDVASETLVPKRGDPAYVPDNEDLRKVYLFAEAVGSYEALHDLMNVHSPGQTLSKRFGHKAKHRRLSDEEVRIVEHYHEQLRDSLKNANHYLLQDQLKDFSYEELHELYQILKQASARAKELSTVLGTHLIHEIEASVERLHHYRENIRTVERTVNGVFLVNSQVMFIPPNELTRCVETIFKAVENPYVANNIDGVMLLAGRNLLIDVMSFYSFYGKQQIYRLFSRGGPVQPRVIAMYIRHEIRKLFEACRADNKLVLTRVMKDAEREFELSVVAIQEEAEHAAFEQVKVFMPVEKPVPEIKRSWLTRMFRWFS